MIEKIAEFLKKYGVKVLFAILIFFFGIVLIKIIISILKKFFSRTKAEKTASKFLTSMIKIMLYIFLVLIVCQYLGIPITGLTVFISAGTLAISLALQGSLSSLANGVVIISTKPFKVGDYVNINDIEGTVKEIKMMHTILVTLDNKEISIPNQKVVESEIVNFNKFKTRKLSLSFPVAYSTDIQKVKNLILFVVINNDYVLLKPQPIVYISSFKESSVLINVDCWCLNENFWKLGCELKESVFNEFKRENVVMPPNQMEIRMIDGKVVLPFDEKLLKKRSANALESFEEEIDDENEFSIYFKNQLEKKKRKRNKNRN